MKKFRCTVRQDAWQNWDCMVEADTAEEAAKIALNDWKTGEPDIEFSPGDVTGFDHAECDESDCEEEIET